MKPTICKLTNIITYSQNLNVKVFYSILLFVEKVIQLNDSICYSVFKMYSFLLKPIIDEGAKIADISPEN